MRLRCRWEKGTQSERRPDNELIEVLRQTHDARLVMIVNRRHCSIDWLIAYTGSPDIEVIQCERVG